MAVVRVVGSGSVLVYFRFEPFVIAAETARSSTRVCKCRGVALSTARLDVQFLSWGGQRRNRRAPHRPGLGGLWQTRQVSCNLRDLLIVQILVRHEGRHGFSGSLTYNAQELSGAELMAGERFGKSTLAALTVAKFAIILETKIPLPNPLPFLNVQTTGRLSL